MGQAEVKFVRPDGGKTLNVLGDAVRSVLVGADTGGGYAVVEQASHPGGGPPLHKHQREDEGFYVLEGDYEFTVGDRTLRATPGTYLFAPRDIPHTFRCVGTKPGRLQVTIMPAGFEAFLEEVSNMAAAGPPDMEEVVALASKYGLDILGPPPGP